MESFVRIEDRTRDEMLRFFELARDMEIMREMGSDLCKGRILGAMFYEPSTRTRLSFESAMYRLGGNVLGFADPNSTSFAKEETLADTIHMLCNYADALVIRHFWAGAAQFASMHSTAPVINAGDDANQHPTQTLTDLYTLWKARRTLSGMTVGVCGDLRFGRAAHSLVYGLAAFDVNIILIAPDGLELPDEEMWRLEHAYGANVSRARRPGHVIEDLDALYVNRLQKERLPDELDAAEIQQIARQYRIDAALISRAKPTCMVLHPLPRVDELARELDGDPRAVYFEQSSNGVPVRMALLALALGRAPRNPFEPKTDDAQIHAEPVCRSKACVSAHEPDVPPLTETVGIGAVRRVCRFCGRFV